MYRFQELGPDIFDSHYSAHCTSILTNGLKHYSKKKMLLTVKSKIHLTITVQVKKCLQTILISSSQLLQVLYLPNISMRANFILISQISSRVNAEDSGIRIAHSCLYIQLTSVSTDMFD